MNLDFNWYIVQTYSGHENKVVSSLKEKAGKEGLLSYFDDMIVPTESVVEVKKGKKVTTDRKIFPGYILVKMHLNDEIWHLIRNTPKVSGFLGNKKKPQPVTEEEINTILERIKEGIEKPKHIISFVQGDRIIIIDGPFRDFEAVVDFVDKERGKLKVSVLIFGRPTRVELEFSQVEKN